MGMLDGFKKQTAVTEIPPEKIRRSPFQPRRSFDEAELEALGESIRHNGLIQPVTVRKTEEGYELVAGERRLLACESIGMKTVPAIVRELDDAEAAAWTITENLQRSDLGIFEEAEGIETLLEIWKVSREEAAKRLGIAPCTLSNKLRLLKLSEKTKKIITENSLTERHARELLRLEDGAKRERAAAYIAKKGLNVPETEKYIDRLCQDKKEKKGGVVYIIRDVRLFMNTFEHAVKTMKSSGIAAISDVSETEDELIYSVRIPKAETFKRRQGAAQTEAAPSCKNSRASVI